MNKFASELHAFPTKIASLLTFHEMNRREKPMLGATCNFLTDWGMKSIPKAQMDSLEKLLLQSDCLPTFPTLTGSKSYFPVISSTKTNET